jgi:ABC-2 type transport system permease protein
MLRRLGQMLVKEFLQVFRDKRTRFVLIGPPIIQMLLFGYAATLEVRHVPTAVLDLDHTRESRELLAKFSSSPYFDVRNYVSDRRQLALEIDNGDALLGIEIPAGFARKLLADRTAPVQAIVDGTDSNTALVALGYVNRVADRFSGDRFHARLALTTPSLASEIPEVDLDSRPWFNSGLQSRWFFVPGVIGSLILIEIVLLTAFAVVREREIGTLEQIMVTPISRTEFILGKTIPFFLIGLADTALIALVGTFWFRVPFRGSVAVLVLGAVIFLLSMLGTGLLISTVSANQQQAMVTGFFFDIPAIIFSGFGFPISSMPEIFQKLSYLDPLRYFLIVIRGVYLKGVGLGTLWPQIAAMAVFAAAALTISVLRFRKSVG